MSDQMKESSQSLLSKVNNIKVDEEIAALLWSVDQLILKESGVNNPDDENNEDQIMANVADQYNSDWKRDSNKLFHRVQKMVEVLDLIKKVVSWVGLAIRDLGEAKKLYVKSMLRIFEKHGFMYSSNGAFPTLHSPTVLSSSASSSSSATSAGVGGGGGQNNALSTSEKTLSPTPGSSSVSSRDRERDRDRDNVSKRQSLKISLQNQLGIDSEKIGICANMLCEFESPTIR